MKSPLRWLPVALMLVLLAPASVVPVRAASDDIIGAAAVSADGLLRVRGNWIRLHGVYIPPTTRQCRSFLQPKYCGNRAAVALNTRIQGFVFCRPVSRNYDSTLNAY